jgi:hypothetical protein
MAEIDLTYIENIISKILHKAHTHPKKLKINKSKHDRLTFACPVCGDSHKNMSAKRGHLYFKNLYFKCYNEGCSGTFTKLCKQFDIKLDPTKRMELINYIDLQFQRVKKDEDEWVHGKLDKLIPIDVFEKYMNTETDLKNFGPVKFGSAVYFYLLNRGIPQDLISKLFYEGTKINGKWVDPYVIFVNKIDDKVIGMQERNLKSGQFRRFKIHSFEELYNNIYKTEMDPIEVVGYNKFSYLFNILNVNFEKTITIFEGYIDSIFVPNSIGAVGINSDYGFLLNNDLSIRFLFDNDNVGKRKSDEYLKKGHSVFLWEKLRDDLSKKTNDPHKYKKWFDGNIKDLNKLIKTVKIHYTELDKYFSNDKFDTIYLNYEKKKKYIKYHKPTHNINWDMKISNLKNI